MYFYRYIQHVCYNAFCRSFLYIREAPFISFARHKIILLDTNQVLKDIKSVNFHSVRNFVYFRSTYYFQSSGEELVFPSMAQHFLNTIYFLLILLL